MKRGASEPWLALAPLGARLERSRLDWSGGRAALLFSFTSLFDSDRKNRTKEERERVLVRRMRKVREGPQLKYDFNINGLHPKLCQDVLFQDQLRQLNISFINYSCLQKREALNTMMRL